MPNPKAMTAMEYVFTIKELKLLILSKLNRLFIFSLKLCSRFFYELLHQEGEKLSTDFVLLYDVFDIYEEIFMCENADQVMGLQLLNKFPFFANREVHKRYVLNAAASTGRLDIILYVCERDVIYERYAGFAFEYAVKRGHIEVVRYFHRAYERVSLTPICLSWAIEERQMEVFEYLRSVGVGYAKGVAMSAVRSRNLEVLKFLHEDGCPWDMYSSQEAVKIGEFEIVKYLHQNGCPFKEDHSILAIKEEKLEILDYLCQNGCVPRNACDVAVKYGQLEPLKYLHGRGCEWSNETAQLAINGYENKVDVMFYLFTNRCPGTDNEEFIKLLVKGSMPTQQALTILTYILTAGFQVYKEVTIDAVEMNRLDVLEYLNNFGHACAPETFNTAIRQNNMDILKYLLSIGQKWDEHSLGIAISLKDLDLVKFLVKVGCSWKESKSQPLPPGEGKISQFLFKKN